MARKSRQPAPLSMEAFEAACRADRALFVEAHFDNIRLAFAGEVVAMSPCGTMCDVLHSGEATQVPVAACRILK